MAEKKELYKGYDAENNFLSEQTRELKKIPKKHRPEKIKEFYEKKQTVLDKYNKQLEKIETLNRIRISQNIDEDHSRTYFYNKAVEATDDYVEKNRSRLKPSKKETAAILEKLKQPKAEALLELEKFRQAELGRIQSKVDDIEKKAPLLQQIQGLITELSGA